MKNVGTTKRFVVVLDTGAGSSFIRFNELLEAMRRKISKRNDLRNVRHVRGKQYQIKIAQIGTKTQIVNFFVVEILAKSVILGCEFCDVHVEEKNQV